MDEPRGGEAVSQSARHAHLRSEDPQTSKKKMQPPPSKKKRGRITIMLGERDSQAMVTYEDAQAVARGPRRHTGIKWRGMTLFTKQAKQPEQTDTQAYIQVGDAMYAMPFEDTKLWQAFVEKERRKQGWHQKHSF